MSEEKCFCISSIQSVFADLRQAAERMEIVISDPQVKQWMIGYRDGICATQERFRITQGKCCCDRNDK